ncbi:MAG: hypothetical protein GY810_03350 [Aureispira sp.]|nr:hypothetical protein [Aureispira sp.]
MKYILWSLALFCLVSCGDRSQPNSSNGENRGSYSLDEEKNCINLLYANGAKDSRCDIGETEEEANLETYDVFKYFEEQQYLVLQVGYYEGGDFQLINLRDGNSKWIGAAPVLSPKGTKVALAQTDLVAGYIYNGFRVYELGKGGPTLLQEITFPEWGAQNAQWVDDETVTFDIIAMDFVGDADLYKLRDTTIRFK